MSDNPVRDAEDAVFQAEAALRAQEREIAEVLTHVTEADEYVRQTRDSLAAGAEDARAAREEEARQARAGELGRDRQVLQERIDRNETTWAEVLFGRDEHPSAATYRDQVAELMREAMAEEAERDPAFGEALARMERYQDDDEQIVEMPPRTENGEAPAGPVEHRSADAVAPEPTRPEHPQPQRRTTQPGSSFGTW